MNKIGIRHEDKYLLERRVPLCPKHVKMLRDQGIEVYVQKSAKRVFKDEEYEAVGAVLVDQFPADVKVIFGVKEMPNFFYRNDDTVVMFSHVIKGQEYNMPMLRKMMELKVNLLDYERIAKDGKRLIFFGRFAGLAGAINSFWSLGQRFAQHQISTPFNKIRQAHTYSSLDEVIELFKHIAGEIREKGLPKEINPLVVGITGYGNVSKGAQEILDLLPIKELSANELSDLDLANSDNKCIIKVVFKEEDLSERIDGQPFELQHYYNNPQEYQNKFENYIPKLSLLMNCMYWDPKFPRIVTKKYLSETFTAGKLRLWVIGDITCDPDGSIECTHTGTPIVNPVYTYNPVNQLSAFGFQGDGILIMAVDILPSELPREASTGFGDALLPFVSLIAGVDFSKEFDEIALPEELKRALILHRGELTPDYKYLNKHLINSNK